jgi:hypothetical protein
MDLDKIEINNNVKINDLFDNKTWIHGTSKENITLTIFLITIQGDQLKYTLDAVNQLPVDIPFIVNVIMNVSPTARAYNEMRVRCKTDYFVQLDEDMVLFPNAIQMIHSISANKSKNVYVFSYHLIDEYLGIGPSKLLEGMKLYNYHIMKNYPTTNDFSTIVSSVDRIWHKQIEADGFLQKNVYDAPIGYHAKYRKPFDLMIRYCKSTQSLLNPSVKKNSGDICRFIKPIQKLSRIFDFYKLFDCLVHHFLRYDPNRFRTETFNKNYTVLLPIMNKYVSDSTLKSYDLDINRFYLSNYEISESCPDFNKLFTIGVYDIFDIFCIIGIINVLFDNYEYSFTKYPYDIYKYFLKVFKFNICIRSSQKKSLDKVSNWFEKYECVTITNNICDPSIDCFIEIDKVSRLSFTINGEEMQFKTEDEFLRCVLDRSKDTVDCKLLQKICNIKSL